MNENIENKSSSVVLRAYAYEDFCTWVGAWLADKRISGKKYL